MDMQTNAGAVRTRAGVVTATVRGHARRRLAVVAIVTTIVAVVFSASPVLAATATPTGAIDTVRAGLGTVTVRGWAVDRAKSAVSTSVRVTIGGRVAGTVPATTARADVNRHLGVRGKHGYSGSVTSAKYGKQSVCITALSLTRGKDVALGCRTVSIRNPSPIGALDRVAATPGTLTVRGWALDPDTSSASTDVTVTVGGTAIATVHTDALRGDVNRGHHVTGRHGFDTSLATTASGTQSVCAVAENVGTGTDTRLGCRTVTVPAVAPSPVPSPPTAPSTTAPTDDQDGGAMPAAASGWTRVFGEDFTTPAAPGGFMAAYGDRFVTYDGFNDTSGAGKYRQSALSVADGTLDMHMHTDASGQPTGAAFIPLVDGRWGGQTSGRYDLRLRADPVEGYGLAGLLWSDTNTWEDGEVDFPEGALDGTVTLSNHCPGNPAANCLHRDTGTTFAAWHTYTIEWSPAKLSFLIDGVTVASTTKQIPTKSLHLVLQAATMSEQKPPKDAAGDVQVAWVSISRAG
ncbi:hypothetical protein BIU98_13095 [Curtobacterium sp. MMLR14_010]|uniref:glycoside hydrolase family 16 protein n=1 Tax=Curtobacterium sp. MMLR14_010 TaxID=1898743 RepID=UPI0008DDB164|nr:glycoside hydrolase family 16 protein [Curtobacterium sp. MMLR14_010]OII38586.1 hypothetical protein BIU98_13095 [Curtobacterium sp. MMLR14_010]